MKAIILAAGYGRRLLPLTKSTPKCLVKIKGVPLLKIWLKELEKSKIKSVLINTHYLNKKIENFVKRNKFNLNIYLKHEKKLLGTAGTLIKNLDFFDKEEGLFLHSDNYCKEPITNLLNEHKNRPANAIITAMTFSTKDVSSCGIFKINKKKVVEKFYEKPKKDIYGNIANAAIYVLSKKFIMLAKRKFKNANNFSEDVIPKLNKKIYCYHTKKTFLDIGTLESYKKVK